MHLAFHVSMLEPATAAIACYAVSKVDRRLLRRPQKMCLWCRRHSDDLLRSVLDEVSEPLLDHSCAARRTHSRCLAVPPSPCIA